MIQKTGCSMQGKQYVKKKTWIARKNPIPCNCKKCLNCIRRKIKIARKFITSAKLNVLGIQTSKNVNIITKDQKEIVMIKL